MRRMYRVILVVLGLLLVALPVPAALAQNPGEDMIADRIVDAYGVTLGVTLDSVKAMHAAGLGWGEIIIILEISRLSGRPVSDIQAMHAGGMGFGQIVRDLKEQGVEIDPGALGQAVAAVMSEGRSQGGQGGQPESPGAAGREHSNGKGKP